MAYHHGHDSKRWDKMSPCELGLVASWGLGQIWDTCRRKQSIQRFQEDGTGHRLVQWEYMKYPRGGKRPWRLAAADIRVRSTSVLLTYTCNNQVKASFQLVAKSHQILPPFPSNPDSGSWNIGFLTTCSKQFWSDGILQNVLWIFNFVLFAKYKFAWSPAQLLLLDFSSTS